MKEEGRRRAYHWGHCGIVWMKVGRFDAADNSQ